MGMMKRVYTSMCEKMIDDLTWCVADDTTDAMGNEEVYAKLREQIAEEHVLLGLEQTYEMGTRLGTSSLFWERVSYMALLFDRHEDLSDYVWTYPNSVIVKMDLPKTLEEAVWRRFDKMTGKERERLLASV